MLAFHQKMAVNLQPYISIDFETTGLDLVKSQILQIAAVYDDGKTPISQLPRLNILVNQPITYTELGALAMHEKTKLFSRIMEANKKKESRHLHHAIDLLIDFINEHRTIREEGKDGKPPSKYKMTLAGKNASTYDIPLLKNWMTDDQKKRFGDAVYHGVIDAGSIYFQEFGRIPSLSNILQLLQTTHGLKKEEVTHDAEDDAIDVITAIRCKMGIAL